MATFFVLSHASPLLCAALNDANGTIACSTFIDKGSGCLRITQMGFASHQENYAAQESTSRKSKKQKKQKKKKAERGRVIERVHWVEPSATEIRAALVDVMAAEAWPKHLKSDSAFQGWHDLTRRLHFANEDWQDVPDLSQTRVMSALRELTSVGEEAWDIILQLRAIAKAPAPHLERVIEITAAARPLDWQRS